MASENHHEYKGHHVVKASTDRSFGLVFATACAAFGGISLYRGGHVWVAWFAAAALFLMAALLLPSILSMPNRLWTRLGLLLAKIMNPIVLGLIYFTIFTPIALFLRLVGKDLLRVKAEPSVSSYWIIRTPPGPASGSMSDQF